MRPWKTLLKLLLIGAAVSAVWWFGPWRSIAHPPGILISSSPHQVPISGHSLPDIEGWKLRAVAEYELRGRV